jgi:hypothetical protein
MNKIFLLFIFCSNFIFSQQEDEIQCGWYENKTVTERNQIFPFNMAKKVVYISFYNTDLENDYLDENGKIIDNDSLLNIYLGKISKKIIETNFNYKYFVKEEKKLSKKQINELSNLIFNFTVERKPRADGSMDQPGCYSPRNAILFYDESDVVIAFTEICFQCDQYYSNWKENIFEFDGFSEEKSCYESISTLKNLLKTAGIKYGITER